MSVLNYICIKKKHQQIFALQNIFLDNYKTECTELFAVNLPSLSLILPGLDVLQMQKKYCYFQYSALLRVLKLNYGWFTKRHSIHFLFKSFQKKYFQQLDIKLPSIG